MKHETTNIIHGVISTISGAFVLLVGGFDQLFIALMVVMGIDWVTGVLKALKKKKFSPNVGLWGIVNKVVTIMVVIAMNYIQNGVGLKIPLRESVLIMLLINEVLSFLRNASTFVKGLEPLSEYFESVKINILKVIKVGEQND